MLFVQPEQKCNQEHVCVRLDLLASTVLKRSTQPKTCQASRVLILHLAARKLPISI
ncbi:hypothetical protein DPMN_088798 [Dreissena polymorpha]|uniref:Uncharacterized protein n=1 Tax=Dreissena polymorpha TaxID=45954 RepID=A0A9D4QXL3_DREPO|nr:hypothetical protein DPMN_088798 [Dreissena polymorpha]